MSDQPADLAEVARMLHRVGFIDPESGRATVPADIRDGTADMSDTSDHMRELIERGSLGTPEAQALRASVPREQVEKVLARAEELRQEDDLAAIIGDLLAAGVRPEEILRCGVDGVRALASRAEGQP